MKEGGKRGKVEKERDEVSGTTAIPKIGGTRSLTLTFCLACLMYLVDLLSNDLGTNG